MEDDVVVKTDGIEIGRYWGAIKSDIVVGVISMKVPNDVDFDLFREKAVDCLSVLGTVKAGVLISRKGGAVLSGAPNHANRSKVKKPAKEYPVSSHVI